MNAAAVNHMRGVRAIIALVVAVVLALSMGLTAVPKERAYAAQQKVRVTLTTPKSISIDQGSSYRIAAKASKGAKLKFKSSKKSVAKVSKKGVVKAKKVGEATITITAKKGKKTAKKKVKVKVVNSNQAKRDGVERNDYSKNPDRDSEMEETPTDIVVPNSDPIVTDERDSGSLPGADTDKPIDPSLVVVPEPVIDPNPPVDPDPAITPDPTIDPDPVIDPDPAISPDPVIDPDLPVDPDLDEVGNPAVDLGQLDEDEKAVEPQTYVVVFDANGGTGSMDDQTLTMDETATLSANSFKNKGYVFAGWNTKENGKGTAYSDKASVVDLAEADDTITLYAQWEKEAPATYSVTFDANGGAGKMAAQEIVVDERTALNANAYARDGYKFVCWSTKANGTGTLYNNQALVSKLAPAGGSITLYAQWMKNSPGTYRINYLPNGGEGCPLFQYDVRRDVEFQLSERDFTREGYTFDGWNTQPDGTGTHYADKQTVCNLAPANGHVTLYAQWVKNPEPTPAPVPAPTTYLVAFDANGGTGSMLAQELKCGTATALAGNTFQRSDYTFSGWNTKANGTGASYADKASVRDLAEAGGKATLYAQWKKVVPTTYTIYFYANGGTGYMSSQVVSEYEIAKLKSNTFTRSGYDFIGWNTQANGLGTHYANNATAFKMAEPGSSISLYAEWRSQKRGVIVEGGKTHYYDTNGNQVFGWIQESAGWRYCDPSTGEMAKGGERWTQAGKGAVATAGYRFFGSDGIMQYGWQTVNAKTKYFRPYCGLRATGYLYISKGECGSAVDGTRYFDENGYIVLGWKRFSDGDRYFEFHDGVMVIGEFDVPYPGGSDRYFFNGNGVRLADVAHGDYYFRASDGAGIRYDSKEFARLVFEEYNRFRLTRSNASGGRYAVTWSGDSDYGSSCGDAREARISSETCAAKNQLVHTAATRRADLRANGVVMSDILYWSSCMRTPSEIINAWASSAGHRQQMQCNTTHHAGFGVAKSSNGYYFSIVYEFSGSTNRSGS